MSMTVEEAIAKFKRTSVLWESASNTEMVEAVKVAISALEEIQQYRAIGTVSELRELKEKATAKWNETQTKSPDSYYPSVRVCSNCNDYYTRDYREMKFCPNCGAKMTED